MKIKFLGSGGAFVPDNENYHSNILIFNKKETLLFDAGFDIKNSLHYFGISPDFIDNLFISHLHGDHCGGVEYIGFYTFFKTKKKIKIISEKSILKDGWKHCWSGCMQALETQTASLETFFESIYLKKNYFIFDKLKIKLHKNIHVISKNKIIPSYGISFKNRKKIYISGDTIFNKKRLEKMENFDYIFHECSFDNLKGHTSFNELNSLNKKIKNKIWLYHYSLNNNSFQKINKIVKKAGFAGLVKRGDEYEF